ncbi:MAG: S26 family signal peptidase [Chloroflexota bacterium]|nr:S26 family signal peptidase [Chloroflexota bacterium]
MFRLHKIHGHSLHPAFHEGEFVLAAGVPFPSGKIRVGDVIIFRQPGYGKLIKRVKRVLADGHAFDVRGTQVESTDSRNFGPVPIENVSGKVIWHIRRG